MCKGPERPELIWPEVGDVSHGIRPTCSAPSITYANRGTISERSFSHGPGRRWHSLLNCRWQPRLTIWTVELADTAQGTQCDPAAAPTLRRVEFPDYEPSESLGREYAMNTKDAMDAALRLLQI